MIDLVVFFALAGTIFGAGFVLGALLATIAALFLLSKLVS